MPRFPLLRLVRSLPCLLALVSSNLSGHAEESAAQTSLIVVRGAGGEKDYEEAFASWTEQWRAAGTKAEARVVMIGGDGDGSGDLDVLRAALQQESPFGPAPLWIVLLGHGTSDGQAPKLNLRGEDLTAAELATWLDPMRRPVVVLATFSASGAFLAPLSSPGRVLVTATRSGSENNYSRFGKFMAAAIADPEADLDHDGQTSVLEAWLRASGLTADFYAENDRLATEHSLIDDNGDGRGTPPNWFEGVRVVKKTSDGAVPDGVRAHQMHLVASPLERAFTAAQREERNALEMKLAALRESKADLPEDDYYAQLEAILRRLALIYRGEKAGVKK